MNKLHYSIDLKQKITESKTNLLSMESLTVFHLTLLKHNFRVHEYGIQDSQNMFNLICLEVYFRALVRAREQGESITYGRKQYFIYLFHYIIQYKTIKTCKAPLFDVH